MSKVRVKSRVRNPHPGIASYRTNTSRAIAASAAHTCGHDDEKVTTVFVTGEDGVVRRMRNCRNCMMAHDLRVNGR